MTEKSVTKKRSYTMVVRTGTSTPRRPKYLLPFLLLEVAVAIWWVTGQSGLVKADDSSAELAFSGVVEARTTDISFEATGTLKELLVDQGDSVKKGQALAKLDPTTAQANLDQAVARMENANAQLTLLRNGPRQAEIEGAQARLRQAQADLDQLRNGATAEDLAALVASSEAARKRWLVVERGSRPEEMESARAGLESARSDLATQERETERYQALFSQGAVSAQVYETQRNRLVATRSNFQTAAQTLERLRTGPLPEERGAARQDYESARQRYQSQAVGTRPELLAKAQATVEERATALQLLHDGSRPEEIEAARQRLKEAQAAVRAARDALGKTELKAPSDGVVTRRSAEAGERLAAGVPVLATADLRRPWVNIYIDETDLSKVRLGQRAEVSADGLTTPLPAKVTYLSSEAEFTPKFIQTQRERTNLVFRAEVTVDNQQGKLHPGLPADVRLLP